MTRHFVISIEKKAEIPSHHFRDIKAYSKQSGFILHYM